MPVILVNMVVDPKRIIGKKWRAEEEERHKGLLTPPPKKKDRLLAFSNLFNIAQYTLHKKMSCMYLKLPHNFLQLNSTVL
jgi:hypothetical protein